MECERNLQVVVVSFAQDSASFWYVLHIPSAQCRLFSHMPALGLELNTYIFIPQQKCVCLSDTSFFFFFPSRKGGKRFLVSHSSWDACFDNFLHRHICTETTQFVLSCG